MECTREMKRILKYLNKLPPNIVEHILTFRCCYFSFPFSRVCVCVWLHSSSCCSVVGVVFVFFFCWLWFVNWHHWGIILHKCRKIVFVDLVDGGDGGTYSNVRMREREREQASKIKVVAPNNICGFVRHRVKHSRNEHTHSQPTLTHTYTNTTFGSHNTICII